MTEELRRIISELEELGAELSRLTSALKEEMAKAPAPEPSPAAKTPKPQAKPQTGIGHLLIEAGLITPLQLNQALQVQKEKGGFLGQILVELGHIKQDMLISFLVKHCKVPHLSLLDYEIDKETLELVPKDFCLERFLLPIDRLGHTLTVAMVDPLDTGTLAELQKMLLNYRIKPVLCNWRHFRTVVERVFPSKSGKEAPVEVKTPPYQPPGLARVQGTGESAPDAAEEFLRHYPGLENLEIKPPPVRRLDDDESNSAGVIIPEVPPWPDGGGIRPEDEPRFGVPSD